MKRKSQLLVLLILLPFLLFMLSPEGAEHSSNSGEFIGKVINFILLFGGLSYFLRKPLMNFLGRRGKELSQTVDESERMKKEWEKKLQEVEKRLKKISNEVESLSKQAEERGEKRKKEILQAARDEANRIKSFSEHQIEALSQQALLEIRQYAADLAVRRAQENIKKKLTLKKQHILVGQAIKRIKGFHEKFHLG